MADRVICRAFLDFAARIEEGGCDYIQACESCGAVCAKHGKMMEHCQICAEASQRCAKACQDLLAE